MEKRYYLFLLIPLFCINSQNSEAQLLNRVKEKVKQTAEDKMVNKAGETTEKTMDKAENGLKGKDKSKDKAQKESVSKNSDNTNPTPTSKNNQQLTPLASYANYDFVPGDKTIFQCDFNGEKDGELPGRLQLIGGNAEVQTLNGEKVLHIPGENTVHFNPQMKTSEYLPEQFTLEFDIMMHESTDHYYEYLEVYFRKKEDQDRTDYSSEHFIRFEELFFDKGTISWSVPGTSNLSDIPSQASGKSGVWKHIAIYVNKNIGKLYVDQHRVKALNNLKGVLNTLTFSVGSSRPAYIKNIRLAQGGDDAYNKVVSDGRFIAYGIQFDVNKASLKPESMGTINEFVKMMQDHADLKFEIGGHTDSDGTSERNNSLSNERAEAVKKQMVSMGIDESRLSTKGYGSTKPVIENNSAENKSKNRRVEFVKM